MEKTKFLTIMSLGLLTINILLIAFVFFRKPPHMPEQRENRNIIIHLLHFDQEQTNAYDTLIHDHQIQLSNYENQISILKKNLFELLKSNGNNQLKDSLIMEIGNKQIAIEKIHYQHFEKIKKLCRQDQMAEFDTLMSEVASMFNTKILKLTANE